MREDTFKVGDKVTWFNEEMATISSGRERYGPGPFTIASIEWPKSPKRNGVGHRQWLHLSEIEEPHTISGAFFKLVP